MFIVASAVYLLQASSATSKPISSPQINLLPFVEILHDVVNAPGLILVSLRIVRRNTVVVFDPESILHCFDALLVVLMREGLSIVLPDPLRQARRRLSRVNLDLCPISLLEKLCVGESDLLSAGGASESGARSAFGIDAEVTGNLPHELVHVDSLFDVLLASNLET